MRKIASLSLGLLSLLSPCAQSASATTFADVAGTRYVNAFTYLSDNRIVEGYPDGTGRPHGSLNRAEALKVILEANPLTWSTLDSMRQSLPRLSLFPDVDQEQWYAPYVETGFQTGIVTGYADGRFRPDQRLTTEEAVALLLRSETRAQGLMASVSPQGDFWYQSSLSQAQQLNLFSPDEQLYIGQPITRGQFFDILYRLDSIRTKHQNRFAGKDGLIPVVPPQDSGTVVFNTDPQDTGTSSFLSYPSDFSVVGGSTTPAPAVPITPPVVLASLGDPPVSTYFAISMPSIGIKDLRVTDPADPATSQGLLAPLQFGVGHLFAYPGEDGKTLIYGHSSGYPWDVSQYTKIFRGINALAVGDRVYVNYHGTTYTYQVTSKESVPAGDTSRFSGPGEELILYTCWPPDSIKLRYLVHANRVQE